MSRLFKRVQLDQPAILTANIGENGTEHHIVTILNISAAGALFYSERPIPLDTAVTVFVLLRQPTERERTLKVRFTGKVIRTEPEAFAVCFDDVLPLVFPNYGTELR